VPRRNRSHLPPSPQNRPKRRRWCVGMSAGSVAVELPTVIHLTYSFTHSSQSVTWFSLGLAAVTGTALAWFYQSEKERKAQEGPSVPGRSQTADALQCPEIPCGRMHGMITWTE
jgi:hypothetical protein